MSTLPQAEAAPPLFSVIVPAFDEEAYLPHCLDAIGRAADRLGAPVEVIVVDNMSHDATARIARDWGARTVQTGVKCLSAIRNTGARTASGEYLVFIDADSYMSPNFLEATREVLAGGKHIGGGVANVRVSRWSLGIAVHYAAGVAAALVTRLSAVAFYTTREAFWAAGGFDEARIAVEDVDFARRLKRLGRRRGLRYKHLFNAHVTTSARKFDEFGDWAAFTHPGMIIGALLNRRKAAEQFWYRRRR